MEMDGSSGAPVLRGSPRPEGQSFAGKHTPGPNEAVLSEHLGDPAWAVRCHDGDLLAVGCLRGDALLYAAAPDLLEALKGALAAFRLFYSFYGDDEHVSSIAEAVAARTAMAEMAAAIARAEGRPQ